MSLRFINSYFLSFILSLLYFVFFISLVFAFNFISSASIGLILIAGALKNKIEKKSLIHLNAKNFFLIACILYYLLQIVSLFFIQPIQETWSHLRIKSALLFVPLALCSYNYINEITREKLLATFCFILFVATLYCGAINIWNYFHFFDSSVFFFHALVRPIHQHAVFFSIYVFISLVYLIEKRDTVLNRSFQIFLILYFSVFIFLLSSKLVIVFYLIYLFYYAITVFAKQKKNRPLAITILFSGVVAIILLLTTRNPVSNRFIEILNTDMKLVKQDKFNPGIYFNDIQFRIVEWTIVTEILNDQHGWLKGVGTGDAQNLLDKKYIEKNMYVGDPARGDKGFLGYNTHNELLESLLQSGIPGAVLFLLIICTLVRMAWQKRNILLGFTVMLLIAFSLIESAFETQYAIMLFTFFPLFLNPNVKEK